MRACVLTAFGFAALVASAHAQDSIPPPPRVRDAPYSWTGPYIGASFGAGTQTTNVVSDCSNTTRAATGRLGGGGVRPRYTVTPLSMTRPPSILQPGIKPQSSNTPEPTPQSADQPSRRNPGEHGGSSGFIAPEPIFPCTLLSSGDQRSGSFAAAVDAGYNYQFTSGHGLVLGIEGGFQPTGLQSDTQTLTGEQDVHSGVTINRLGTVLLRGGYAIDRLFVYGTGGLAIGDIRAEQNVTETVLGDPTAYASSASRASVKVGNAFGGGVEYALSDRLSLRLEGLRYTFGSIGLGAVEKRTDSIFLADTIVRSATVKTDGLLVHAGLNYHLNGFGLPDGNDVSVASFSAILAPDVWRYEAGLRYFYSSGSFRYSLDAPADQAQLNSRLTYGSVGAHAAEAFTRIDHRPTGLFLKGYVGGGGIGSGALRDEDFPPATNPYSNTASDIRNGDIAYASVDLGYRIVDAPWYQIGGFLGYHYLGETMNSYGCAQTATNHSVCTPAISVAVKGLSEDAQWNAVRLGVAGQLRYGRLRLDAEAAYLPFVALDGLDHHWLRPNINAVPQHGTDNGYQFESILSYDVTRAIAVGLGGRFWMMSASGTTQFPGAAASPTRFATERVGGFLQLSYRFGD